MASPEEIKANAFKLEQAGASSQEIEDYVSLAVKETPKPSLMSSIASSVKSFPSTVSTISKSFFPALARGFTFNKIGGQQPTLAGSIMEPSLERVSRQAGGFVGQGTQGVLADVMSGGLVNPVTQKLGAGALSSMFARQAVAGGGLFGTQNIAEKGIPKTGEAVGELAGEVAKGAGIFSAVGLVGKLAGDLKKYLGGEVSGDLMDTIIGTTKKQAKADLTAGEFEHLGSKVADIPGISGSRKTMLEKANVGIDDLEEQIQKTLNPFIQEENAAKFSSIDTKKVAESFKPLEDSLENTIGTKEAKSAIEEFKKELFEKYGDVMTIEKAQLLKRNTWKIIKENSFLKQLEETPLQAQLQRYLGKGLKDEIARVVPEIAELNARQGVMIGLRNTLQDTLASGRGFQVSDIVMPAIESGVSRTARGLRMFDKSKSVVPAVGEGLKQGSRIGLSEMFKKNEK